MHAFDKVRQFYCLNNVVTDSGALLIELSCFSAVILLLCVVIFLSKIFCISLGLTIIAVRMQGESEESFSQAKDFGFKLAMEVRQLRKMNEEDRIHISDLTETKDTMIRKYESLFAKHRSLQREKEDLENKCLTLEDLVFKLEIHVKEMTKKHEGDLAANAAKIANFTEINENLHSQLNSSTEMATNQYNELVALRNKLAAVDNDNLFQLQKVDNLSAQLSKIQGHYDTETLSARAKDEEIVRLKNLVHEGQLQLTELESTAKAYKERHIEDGREKEALKQTVESLELVQQKSTAELKDLRYKVVLMDSKCESCCEAEKNEYRLTIQQLRQECDRLKLDIGEAEGELHNFRVAVELQNMKWQQPQHRGLRGFSASHDHFSRRPAAAMEESDLSSSSSSVADLFATPRSARDGGAQYNGFTPSTIGSQRPSRGPPTAVGDPMAFYHHTYSLIEKLKRKVNKYYQLAHQYRKDGKDVLVKYQAEREKTKKLLQAVKIYEDMCEQQH